MQVDIDQQCSQIIAKRQPTAIDLRMILTITKIVNDLERIGDEVKKIAYKAAQTRGSDRLHAGAPLRRDARGRARARRCCSSRSTPSRGSTPRAAAEVIDRDEEIDVAFSAILRQLDQLHDGRPADDHAGARDRVHRQVDRAHRRPRQEHRRGRRAAGQGQGRAPRVGRRRSAPRWPRNDAATDAWSVEDEPAILELLKVNLVDAGYEVQRGARRRDARRRCCRTALPDLVLLDWMLPGQSGLALARELRADARTRELPIIMVTARTDEADKVAGLEAWVDDYVTKPFSPRELKARIKAVLRRRAPRRRRSRWRSARCRLDPAHAPRDRRRQPVQLGPTEFRLLRFFLARPERVHTRTQLLDQVWGDHVYIEERTVDVHIRRLRLALEPFGQDRADRDRARQRLPARGAAVTRRRGGR